MASITKRVAAAIQKEFVEGTIFRVDLDHVDVAPAGSTGILRSLPLTGDREKVKPGDPVRVINVAGERVAMVGDVAFVDELGEVVEDASEIELAEKLSTYSQVSSAGNVEEDTTSPMQINDGWVFTGRLYSANWTNKVVSTTAKTAINVVSEFGVPDGAEAVIARVIAKDSGSGANPDLWVTVAKSALTYEGTTTAFVGGLLNNSWSEGSGVVGVNEDGTIYYQVRASGTNTMTINLEIWGYKLPAFEMGSGGSGWIYLNKALTNATYHPLTSSTVATRTEIDAPTVFGVPADAKAIILRVASRDTGSATNVNPFFGIWSDPVDGNSFCMGARPGGMGNNAYYDVQGIVPLTGGKFWYTCNASGTNTLQTYLQVYGYMLGEESTAQGWVFFDQPIVGPNWNPATVATNTTTGTPINFLTEFNLPAGTKAVIVRGIAYDAGSAAATDQWFGLQTVSSASAIMPFLVRTNGMTNNARGEEQGIVPLDANGYAYWKCSGATGAGMGVYLRVVGYLLPTDVTRTTAENLQGYTPDTTGAANAHVPVTTGDGTLKLASLDVSGAGNFPWMVRVPINLTGGGTVTCNLVSTFYYVKWSYRFIAISNGRGTSAAPGGYYNISVPAAGTVIPTYGGAVGTRTVDATNGIPLNPWDALYYEIPLTSGVGTVDGNFRIVHYAADFQVPANWLLLAVMNGDSPYFIHFTANGGFSIHAAGSYIAGQDQPVALSFIIDGGGGVLTTGLKGAIAIPYHLTINRVAFYSQETGSATVQLLKFNSYTGWPGSDYYNFGDHVMTNAQKIEWTGLNYGFAPGNVLRFWLQSVSAVKNLSIHLMGYRL